MTAGCNAAVKQEPVWVKEADLAQHGSTTKAVLDYLSDTEIFVEDKIVVRKLDSFPRTMVVGGLPSVGNDESKAEKLTNLLRKKFLKGDIEEMEFWRSVEGSCAGEELAPLLAVTFVSREDALEACSCVHGSALDAKHKLMCVMMDDFDGLLVDEESCDSNDPSKNNQGREHHEVDMFVREEIRWWMRDERQREQLLMRFGTSSVDIRWHDACERAPVLVTNRGCNTSGKPVGVDWTKLEALWSPQGSYLATTHDQGVALWAGRSFIKCMRYSHSVVKAVEFSPDEEYLVTWDGRGPEVQCLDAVRIFQVRSGKCLLQFQTPPYSPCGSGCFPFVVWSANSEYLAVASERGIIVYQSATMQRLKCPDGGREFLKFPTKIENFQWSPCVTDNILAIWTPERDNDPGRLALIEVPSRQELTKKNVFNIIDATLHWQSRGDFLCLIVNRFNKSKKSKHSQLEIFRLREKKLPVELLEIAENIHQFTWSPCGSRFGIIVCVETTKQWTLRFYQMKQRGWEVTCSADLSMSNNTELFWSPHGSHFVLATFGGDGTLYFGGLSADGKSVDFVHKDDHFMINGVSWDPSGRFVMTSVTGASEAAARYSQEHGYIVWTFQGRLLYRILKPLLYRIAWRPHPTQLLPHEKIEEVKKNLRNFSKGYDTLDEKLRSEKKEAFFSQRKAGVDEFLEILEAINTARREHTDYDDWEDCWDELEEAVQFEDVEERFEEVLSEHEEVVHTT